MSEADFDLTSSAMNQNRFAMDQYLAVKFYLYPMKNETKTIEAGRLIVEDVEFVEIMQPGNKDAIYRCPATALDKARFPVHYEKFKARIAGAESALEGTPLSDWPGVSRGQAEELAFFNVRTVEQLANLADNLTGKMMGLVGLKQKAIKYLETASASAAVEALASARAEIEAMKAQMAEFMAAQQPEEDDPLDKIVPRGTYEANQPVKRYRRSKAEMAAAMEQSGE